MTPLSAAAQVRRGRHYPVRMFPIVVTMPLGMDPGSVIRAVREWEARNGPGWRRDAA